jgi:hypothetical protein
MASPGGVKAQKRPRTPIFPAFSIDTGVQAASIPPIAATIPQQWRGGSEKHERSQQ